jgi:hypothetical protein
MLSGKAAFQISHPEQAFHQQGRINIAALGHQHEANILRRFIAECLPAWSASLACSISAIFSIRRDFCT